MRWLKRTFAFLGLLIVYPVYGLVWALTHWFGMVIGAVMALIMFIAILYVAINELWLTVQIFLFCGGVLALIFGVLHVVKGPFKRGVLRLKNYVFHK